MKKALLLVAFASLVFAPAANADIINFDDVANNTVINNHYLGVTFVNPLDGSDIFSRDAFSLTNTGNVVSVNSVAENPTAPFNSSTGAVDAIFANAMGRVSVDVSIFLNSGDMLGNSPLNAFMEVYNGTTLLAQIYDSLSIGSGQSASGVLTFTSATDNITRVRLSVQSDSTGSSGTAMFGEFDNLSFDARTASGQFPSTGVTNPVPGGGTGGGTPVPEPSSLLLLGCGVVGMFGRRQFRKN